MGNVVPAVLAMLVFALIISVWNWVTATLPGSVDGGLNWIMLLIAAIAALAVYLSTQQR